MMKLSLYTLGTEFKVARSLDVATMSEATAIVAAHIADSGYAKLRVVDDDEDIDSRRFVADPPKGRKGRNVAAIDY